MKSELADQLMHIAALQTFLAVVEAGNLNRAAERLNISQSAVTARLDALEERLGQPVLVRSRTGAQLTRAGFIFRPFAETIVRGWEQAQSAVGLPTKYSGLFSFACEFDLWASAGKHWLETQRASHPDLAYEAWPGSRDEIKTWLDNGLTDVALTMEPLHGHGLSSRPLAPQRLVQVAATGAGGRDPEAEYVYVDLGPEFRRQHVQIWGRDARAAFTFAASEWALEHLLGMGGRAYLPWSLAVSHLDAGTLELVEDAPEFSRSMTLIWRDSSLASFPWIGSGDLLDGCA